MKLTIVNGNGGNDPYDVMVHKAGCRDLGKLTRNHDHWNEEHSSQLEAWLEYNYDFLSEGSGAWPLHFFGGFGRVAASLLPLHCWSPG